MPCRLLMCEMVLPSTRQGQVPESGFDAALILMLTEMLSMTNRETLPSSYG